MWGMCGASSGLSARACVGHNLEHARGIFWASSVACLWQSNISAVLYASLMRFFTDFGEMLLQSVKKNSFNGHCQNRSPLLPMQLNSYLEPAFYARSDDIAPIGCKSRKQNHERSPRGGSPGGAHRAASDQLD